MAIEVNDKAHFDELIKEGVVLVDFWAERCGPCRMLWPIIEEVSDDLGDKVKVLKVDVDKNQELAAKYEIRSIPSVFIFKNGEAQINIVWVNQKSVYIDKIEELIKDINETEELANAA